MYDVAIIGAGVVGSAAARRLAKYDLKVSLVEKESDVSTGASKANTGIVHGGYVAQAGTLKGELCIKGNAMYEKLNEELNFGYLKTGGLVLAFDQEDKKTLQKLYDNALKVGQTEADFKISPMRGEYVVFSKSEADLVKTVIFQAPNPKTKGVVATTTTHGNFMIGPNAEEIEKKEDVSTTLKEIKYIINQARKSIADFDTNRMLKTFAGLRPKTVGGDFIIKESKVKGFILAAGIDSPGLTSSPAIAQKLVDILAEAGLDLEKKDDFNPNRPAIVRKKGPDFEAEIDHQNPAKNIICRCESVTEAEILDALSRSIPIKTTDAVKRRTWAKTGECQANFCESRIKKILSRELEIPLSQIKNRDEDYEPERINLYKLKKQLKE